MTQKQINFEPEPGDHLAVRDVPAQAKGVTPRAAATKAGGKQPAGGKASSNPKQQASNQDIQAAEACDNSALVESSDVLRARGEAVRKMLLLQPEANAAVTIAEYSPFADENLIPNYAALVALGQQILGGDLGIPERMLMAQANTLDAIFNRLALLAAETDTLPKQDMYMRLALRAQNQARATLESLAMIKNPPVVFAKQANIAAGPQQVNNAVVGPSRAREVESEQSKLLEVNSGERLDPRAAGTAGATHQDVEAVAVVDGPEDNGRQGAR